MPPSAPRTATILAFALTLGIAGGASAQAGKPTVIDVQLSEFRFSPKHIDLTNGQAYLLKLTNRGKHGHDFSAKAFFQTANLGSGASAKVENGEVDVPEGQTVEVELTPGKPGSYEMHCPRPFHSMLGMHGKIVVR